MRVCCGEDVLNTKLFVFCAHPDALSLSKVAPGQWTAVSIKAASASRNLCLIATTDNSLPSDLITFPSHLLCGFDPNASSAMIAPYNHGKVAPSPVRLDVTLSTASLPTTGLAPLVPHAAISRAFLRRFHSAPIHTDTTFPMCVLGGVYFLTVTAITPASLTCVSPLCQVTLTTSPLSPIATSPPIDTNATVCKPTIDRVVELLALLAHSPAVPRGILLLGQAGSGKSHALSALHSRLASIQLTSTPVLGCRQMRVQTGQPHPVSEAVGSIGGGPTVVLFDDLDSLDAPGEVWREIERVVEGKEGMCIVATATEHHKEQDTSPLFARCRRFFHTAFPLPAPDTAARGTLFTHFLATTTLIPPSEQSLALAKDLAGVTAGYLPADIEAICRSAALAALVEAEADGEDGGCVEKGEGEEAVESQWVVSPRHLWAASQRVLPSALHSIGAVKLTERFSDVGGYEDIKGQLTRAVLWPLTQPTRLEHFGLPPRPSGCLLHGPPGTGKTLLARAVVGEAGLSAVAVAAPSLLRSYFGESEAAVRALFATARRAAPCVLLIDEIDAIGQRRSGEAHGVGGRVLTTLLNEMDGVGSADGVFVVACTNRFDALDPALVRPGRLDQHVGVLMPTPNDRVKILEILLSGVNTLVAPAEIAQLCDHDTHPLRSGAEIRGLVNTAGLCALARDATARQILHSDFSAAIKQLRGNGAVSIV